MVAVDGRVFSPLDLALACPAGVHTTGSNGVFHGDVDNIPVAIHTIFVGAYVIESTHHGARSRLGQGKRLSGLAVCAFHGVKGVRDDGFCFVEDDEDAVCSVSSFDLVVVIGGYGKGSSGLAEFYLS